MEKKDIGIIDLDNPNRTQAASKKDFRKLAIYAIKNYNKMYGAGLYLYDPENSLSKEMYENNPHIYINSTEALNLKNHVKKGDTVATVLGSGDFVLDAAYHGASEILTFDINRLQYPVGALKATALSVLSYEEFFSFFSDVDSRYYLSPVVYELIRKRIQNKNLPILSFWDEIMKQLNADRDVFKRSSMYVELCELRKMSKAGIDLAILDIIAPGMISGFNDVLFNRMCSMFGVPESKVLTMLQGEAGEKIKGSFLESKESYQVAQNNIKSANIGFVQSDISKLKITLDLKKYTRNSEFKGFNLIYLSNIPEYVGGVLFNKILDNQLMPLLSEEGSILYCCQGVSLDSLTDIQIDALIEENKENAQMANIMRDAIKLFEFIRVINVLESYKSLRKKYHISIDEHRTYGGSSSGVPIDTYVKIKK